MMVQNTEMIMRYLYRFNAVFLFVLFVLFVGFLFASERKALTLYQAMELSLKQNPFLLAERLNQRIAEGEVVRARTYPNPVFNNQQLFRSKPDGSLWRSANRQDWIQITQSIPVAGQRSYSIEKAKNNLHLTQKQIQEFERNLLFLVGMGWFEAKLIQERLDLVSQTLDSTNELLKINHIRLKNEAITKAEYMRTENLVESYRALFLDTETQFKNEIRNLKFLLALDLDPNLSPVQISVNDLDDLKKDGLISYTLKNRTDILVAHSSVLVARSQLKMEEAFAVPTPEIGIIYNPQNGEQYMGTYVNIPIPIFDRNQGAIISAKAELLKADKQRSAMEKMIEMEVRNALQNLETAKSNYKRFLKIYQSSEEIVKIVRYSYLKGGTTVIDFLDAQRNWFEAQINYLEAKFKLYRAYLELDFTTGKILEKVK
jgi:outer membrane protein, heavy metal efflux system